MSRVFVDHSEASVERTRWRTLAVFGHTFSCSARVVGRAAAGRLSPRSVDAVVDRWCGHVFRLSKTTLTAEGLDRFDPHQPYVLLSNHRSLLDIPAICATFPGRVRFVAKAELRKVPMFGRAMAEAGIIFVDRNDRARAIEALSHVDHLAESGSSLWIAAEGGRSADAGLGPFKKGPFHVAMQLGVPILPTWIVGTDDVIPAGSLVSVTGQRVHVTYGEPIPTEGADLPTLMASARTALEALRATAPR
ncbi:MAG: lysophospholipid acyltransferase family protein [Myxococcota bacterium]